jgi:hypothetical protein
MKKVALVTLVIGKRHKNIYKITKESLFNYTKKIKADFILYDGEKYKITKPDGKKEILYSTFSENINFKNKKNNMLDKSETFKKQAWQLYIIKKIDIVELLKEYERVVFVDCDIIISDQAPNIFEEVPSQMVGMYNESELFNNYQNKSIDEWCNIFNINSSEFLHSSWDGSYYNSGVMVFSRGHEKLFTRPKFLKNKRFFEQNHINKNIMNFKIPMYPLPYFFNRMFFIDSLVPDSRHNSFFIHYAGAWDMLEEGRSSCPNQMLSVMQHDLNVLNGKTKIGSVKKADVDRWWEI